MPKPNHEMMTDYIVHVASKCRMPCNHEFEVVIREEKKREEKKKRNDSETE
jgi:hypothetical protein